MVTQCVGDNFQMLMTYLGYWPICCTATNILKLSPSSNHQHQCSPNFRTITRALISADFEAFEARYFRENVRVYRKVPNSNNERYEACYRSTGNKFCLAP